MKKPVKCLECGKRPTLDEDWPNSGYFYWCKDVSCWCGATKDTAKKARKAWDRTMRISQLQLKGSEMKASEKLRELIMTYDKNETTSVAIYRAAAILAELLEENLDDLGVNVNVPIKGGAIVNPGVSE